MAQDNKLIDKAQAPDDEQNSIEELLGHLEERHQTGEFSVNVLGKILYFRRPETAAEYDVTFKRQAVEFLAMVRGIEAGQKSGPLKPTLETVGKMEDYDVLTAFAIAFWSSKRREHHITAAQALRLVKANPVIASGISAQIDVELRNGVLLVNFGGLAQAEKKSNGARRKSSDSKRPVRSTISTPTT